MVALVTGGGGRLGNVLVRRLLENGQKVRVLEPGTLPESLAGLDIEFMSGSVLDTGEVARATDGVNVVYHLAAKIDLSPKKDPMMYIINVEGTRNVVDACLSSGLRLVHTSSHHALEREPLDQPLTEDKPLALNEKCEYHRSKAIGETIVLDACERGLDAVIVNPGSMIGPHDYEPSMIGAVLIDLYFGRVPVLLEMLPPRRAGLASATFSPARSSRSGRWSLSTESSPAPKCRRGRCPCGSAGSCFRLPWRGAPSPRRSRSSRPTCSGQACPTTWFRTTKHIVS
ncbi:MAG: NAD-dependent epimerase/dehydratase family protein [Deltaproteobacteria bacterium]|nr:NAD-dependent epimerase/dehydratase family protein [Deltaproteobacteria bacterium]